MEAELLGSIYKCIQVYPSAIKAQGEMDEYNGMSGFYIAEFTQSMLDNSLAHTLIVCSDRVKVDKTTGQTWSAGESIYWENSTSKFTKIETATTKLVGRAIQSALSNATYGFIIFNGELDDLRGAQMVTGTATFTGSTVDIDTGLTLIESAFVTVKTATQGAGEAAYVTVDFGADGLLDLYAWDDAGAAATVSAIVHWTAFGLKYVV